MNTGKRLDSLDALRGFDMFFILGGASLIAALCSLFPGGADSWLAMQMDHVEWHGLRHHDTIFPLFLFISGMSFPFSYAKSMSLGVSKTGIYLKTLKRGLFLVLAGLVYQGILNFEFADFRYAGVLQRIGLAWMFAALLYITFPKVKVRAVIASVTLIGYWLLLQFVPAPDAPGADPFSFEGNLVGYIDRCILPGRLYEGTFDPEGILSTVPAIVTAMLGMFTGEFVRSESFAGKALTPQRKTVYLFAAAAILLAAGLLWSLVFPVNKKLWTSSFVLVVAAYSVAMFALFYWIMDVKGWKKWAFFFKVIGMNSITIFFAQRVISFRNIGKFFFSGVAGLFPEQIGSIIISVAYIAAWWLFLLFLYRKKVFLRI